MKPFSEQLIEARKQKGWTQEQLASEMHITRQGVSRWENGYTAPDIEAIRKLSQLLSYDFIAIEESLPSAPPAAQKSPIGSIPQLFQRLRSNTVQLCALCLVIGLAIGSMTGYLLPRPVQAQEQKQTQSLPSSSQSSDVTPPQL